jgi:hypothetical protein
MSINLEPEGPVPPPDDDDESTVNVSSPLPFNVK